MDVEEIIKKANEQRRKDGKNDLPSSVEIIACANEWRRKYLNKDVEVQ